MTRTGLVALLLVAVAAPNGPLRAQSSSAGAERPAYFLGQGSVARNQVVAVARDLVVEGQCLKGASVLGGSARVRGSVAGDLVVVGGSVTLEKGARVAGDVYVFGGELHGGSDVSIGGRSMAYPTAPSTWLLLLEGPMLGDSATDPMVLAAKLALMAAWLIVCLVLLVTGSRELLNTADVVRDTPARSFFVGLTGVLAAVITAVFLSAFTGTLVGVPMLVLLVLVALMLKLWGTAAVFVAVGRFLLERLGRRYELPLVMALAGLVVLGGVKLLPILGVWVWTVVTLVGVGASLASKFGRLEPWLQPGPDLS